MDKRFEFKNAEKSTFMTDATIIVDKKTGVNYLFVRSRCRSTSRMAASTQRDFSDYSSDSQDNQALAKLKLIQDD